MNETLKLGLILFLITAIAATILGVSNMVTWERIAEADERAREAAKKDVLSIATDFEPVDEGSLKSLVGSNPNILEINEGFNDSQLVGYTFNIVVNGYGGEIAFMTGISKEGKVTGLKVISHAETPGLGANSTKAYFANSFKNKSIASDLTAVKQPESDSEVQAITSATTTTNAIVDGVNMVREIYNESLSN